MIFNRKNFSDSKKIFAQKFFSLYRYIIRKIFFENFKLILALCVDMCYYMIVAKITTQ